MITTVVVINVATVAAAAAITYALSNRDGSQVSSTPSSLTPVETYSDAEQSEAKDKVCHTFDVGERGSGGQGGVVVNGELNVPIVLRKVNSVLAVGNALTSYPATPPDVTVAAKKYVSTATDLTSAALAKAPVDDLVKLTQTGNAAMADLSDVCGLPR